MTTTDQARRKRALERLRDPERGAWSWGTFDNMEALERYFAGSTRPQPTVGDTVTLSSENRTYVFTDEGWLSLSGVNGV